MADRRNWQDLECTNCAGTLFVRPFGFIKHKTQGTSEKPYGVVCFTCGRDGDPAEMALKMDLARRAAELEDLQAQQAELQRRRQELDDKLFEEDPVEVRDLVVKRAKAVRERSSSGSKSTPTSPRRGTKNSPTSSEA
jgi:hypothetical protein